MHVLLVEALVVADGVMVLVQMLVQEVVAIIVMLDVIIHAVVHVKGIALVLVHHYRVTNRYKKMLCVCDITYLS